MEARERYLLNGGSKRLPANALNAAKRLVRLVDVVRRGKERRECKKVS